MAQSQDERQGSRRDSDEALERISAQIFRDLATRVKFADASPGPGFDPLTAPDDVLEQFKLPPRPDRKTAPRAFANWQRAMSPPLRFVAPERLPDLVADLHNVFTVTGDRRQRQFVTGLGQTEEMSRNWSGAYIRDNPGEGYVLIQARWVVPRPYPPPPVASGANWLQGDYFSSAWIGLDGHDGGSLSLPQIGTAHHVSTPADTSDPGALAVTAGAWWQWWVRGNDLLNYPVDITQFPVQPGDLVYAQLNVLDPTKVRFFLKNQSVGLVFPPFDVNNPAPPSPNPTIPVTVEGRTAAWIVERPTKPFTPDPLPFCDCGSVTIYDCNAQVAPTLQDRQLQRANLIKLADWTRKNATGGHQPGMDHPGIIVSTAEVESDSSVLITYTGDTP
jgi:Peptidase A4 family